MIDPRELMSDISRYVGRYWGKTFGIAGTVLQSMRAALPEVFVIVPLASRVQDQSAPELSPRSACSWWKVDV